eukprot:TRINITY_DN5541_c0_g1_i3.p1 TRINITY_DN5541_c0_g1~~TRINITY_DN5541_c0_g1_i3.p1  ORF type:complete len:117 (-),score=8.63 TRINITY_DN5541_c0_g1_i3:171-521(-)
MCIRDRLNTTLCLLKLERFKHLINVADKILKIDPQSVKASYRKSFALYKTQEYDESLQCLSDLEQSHAEGQVDKEMMGEVRKLRETVSEAKRLYDIKQRKIYTAYFNSNQLDLFTL